MQVRELMQRNVTTVRDDEPLGLAAQLMLWANAHHLPVTHDGKLCGVLSERDVLRFRAEHAEAPLFHLVGEAMSTPPHFAYPEDSVAEVSGRMAMDHIGCLPVVEMDRIVGIVTTTDVLVAHEREQLSSPPGNDVPARDIMTTRLVTIEADDHLLDAAGRMARHEVRHLPVVNGDGQLIGMLSDRDLRVPPGLWRSPDTSAAGRRYLADARVRDVMTTDVEAFTPEASLALLSRAFVDERLSAVPIVDAHRKLVGLVSYIDLVRALAGRSPQ